MSKKFDFTQLTALLELEEGRRVDDGAGGQTVQWDKKVAVWAAVRQRFMPRPSHWEGGQAPFMLTYTVVMDAEILLPKQARFRWKHHILHPLCAPAPMEGGMWQQVPCVLGPQHD